MSTGRCCRCVATTNARHDGSAEGVAQVRTYAGGDERGWQVRIRIAPYKASLGAEGCADQGPLTEIEARRLAKRYNAAGVHRYTAVPIEPETGEGCGNGH